MGRDCNATKLIRNTINWWDPTWADTRARAHKRTIRAILSSEGGKRLEGPPFDVLLAISLPLTIHSFYLELYSILLGVFPTVQSSEQPENLTHTLCSCPPH